MILCATALMIGGFAFAQVTPQAPTQAVQIANLNPGGAPNANTGESVQNGNDQKVRVRQVGIKNSAATYQDDGTGTGGNLGYISQNGGVSGVSGEENRAEMHQRGSANQATSLQQGDGNSSLINQGLNNTASANNKARVQQGNNNQAEDNWAEVNQDGDGNQSRTLQRWDNNRAWTKQDGNANKSDIHQKADPNQSDGHFAEVDQLGDVNQALLFQDGDGARNMATTVQVGDNNSSVQNQYSTGTTGTGNNAYVMQGHEKYVGNPIIGDLYYGGLMTVDDIQNGSFNPGSDGAIARQEQTGMGNVVQSAQFGQNNESYQKQVGDDNRGLIVQNAWGNANGQSNKARQVQTGDDNNAAIGQNGSNHIALQVQEGNSNMALSTQRGNKNLTNIHQYGDNNWATTGQRGQHNKAFVTQYDGQSYSVTQNLGDGMPNGGNQADILQQGPGGTASSVYKCDVDSVDPGTFTPIIDLDIPNICPGC